MNKARIVLLCILMSNCALSKPSPTDSLSVEQQAILRILENQVIEIRQGQLNYQIEKDLLKETYSKNIERINLTITIILGIFGILGFFGLKDINSLKKDYERELSGLKVQKQQLESKIEIFDATKTKFEEEIKGIMKLNKDQDDKIKLLELKDKVAEHFKNARYQSALEYCIGALDISPRNVDFLSLKAICLTRLGNYDEGIITYREAREIDKHNQLLLSNLTELLLFNNQIKEAEVLINENESYFRNKCDGKILGFFEILKSYHTKSAEEFLEETKALVNFDEPDSRGKRINDWDLQDAILLAQYKPIPEKKDILLNILRYLDGQLSSKDLLQRHTYKS